MRVQPHLPSRPLVAMVTSRSGLALSACSAANRPAPPEPRIKTSVLRRSRVMQASEHAREQKERDDRRQCRGNGRKLFLPVAPRKVFYHQQTQSSQHMHHEQKHERAFAKLHQRLIAPTQKILERRFATDGKAERQEMRGQENGERQAGKPMHQGSHPKDALAVSQISDRHGSTTAATARAPRISSS